DLVTEPMKEDGVTNILLIGNDSRSQGEDGRSDAMILLSISNKTKKIHMTSLLRDMYVEIPGKDGNRLNAAYAYGGPTLLLETIEQNLGITVNRYVLVNFQAFANLVDAVGGVDLELSNEEVKWVNAYLNEYNLLEGRDITTDYLDESLSGMIHLNGPQALAYCRNRYIGTDFERTNRQRKVIAGIVSKLPVALATNSGELADGLFPQLTTNLTQAECYSLSLQASKFLTYEMIQSSIPIEGSYKNATIRSMSVLEVDYEMNKQYIRENIYGEE
ncbi:MAG: LCP family protein, partial [Lachnospiraceae bacterium]|nr:LCP family protein [Lachnospiraceae bacterium]